MVAGGFFKRVRGEERLRCANLLQLLVRCGLARQHSGRLNAAPGSDSVVWCAPSAAADAGSQRWPNTHQEARKQGPALHTAVLWDSASVGMGLHTRYRTLWR